MKLSVALKHVILTWKVWVLLRPLRDNSRVPDNAVSELVCSKRGLQWLKLMTQVGIHFDL